MTFSERYDLTITRLDLRLGDLIDSGHDFELDRSGDVLTLTFEDGERIVITPQSPMSQLWVSASYHGYRFNWSEEMNTWLDEKSPLTLDELLSTELSKQLNEELTI